MRKEEYIKFRCSPLEKAIIEEKAKLSGQSVSSFCRSSALNKKIGFKLTEEELQAYEMLVKYHNNFSRITNLLPNKDTELVNEITTTVQEIKQHLQKFK